MLNVDHHPMSSKGMLEGGGKTRKIRLLKQKSATSHFSSYCDKIIHHKCFVFFVFLFVFLRILSLMTSSLVIFQMQALLFWLEDVMFTQDKRHKVYILALQIIHRCKTEENEKA